MTLEKAIEILRLDKNCDFEGDADDLEKAINLGIEALKRLQDARFDQRIPYTRPLPGETEEQEMECPRCNSEKIEVVRQYPTVDYAEHGEYVCVYRCGECGLEFQQTYTADENIFHSD